MSIRPTLTATLLLSCAFAGTASAATYRVGSGWGCSHSDLQAAINAAAARAGQDTILVNQGAVARGKTFAVTGQDLNIVGGYTSCIDTTVDLEKTTIDGSNSGKSVFTIRGPGVVRLENLSITGGGGPGDGGGIHYQGSGSSDVNVLALARTTVEHNGAGGRGGGIYFTGTASRPAELIFENDTGIFRNHAFGDGGGVYLAGRTTFTGHAHRIFFHANQSFDANGGAMYVKQPATASLGSATWDVHSTFQWNVAGRDGGAIFVEGANTSQPTASVRLYSMVQNSPMRFTGNTAHGSGGTFAVLGNASGGARICTRNITVRGSRAFGGPSGDGGGAVASLLDGELGSCDTFPQGLVAPCGPGNDCEVYAQNGAGESTVRMRGASRASFDRARFDANVARDRVFDLRASAGRSPVLVISGSALTRNVAPDATAAPSVIAAETGSVVWLRHTTLSENLPGRGTALERADFGTPATFLVERTVVNEPGSASHDPSLAITFESTMVTPHAAIVPSPPHLVTENPRLLPCDSIPCTPVPAGNSPALDFAPATVGEFDIDGLWRGVDLANVVNRHGPTDLGAVERQSP